jgi:hypothetical protein
MLVCDPHCSAHAWARLLVATSRGAPVPVRRAPVLAVRLSADTQVDAIARALTPYSTDADTRYVLEGSGLWLGGVATAPGNATRLTLTGLRPSTPYRVAVVAVNAVGPSRALLAVVAGFSTSPAPVVCVTLPAPSAALDAAQGPGPRVLAPEGVTAEAAGAGE